MKIPKPPNPLVFFGSLMLFIILGGALFVFIALGWSWESTWSLLPILGIIVVGSGFLHFSSKTQNKKKRISLRLIGLLIIFLPIVVAALLQN
jgi:hypothetical protein